MLGWTDRHARYFLRLFSPNIRLYTEMVTTGALKHGQRLELLTFSTQEHPVALQLGGSDPAELAYCAQLGEAWGYDEINLNIGCPSNRVQSGGFGACLMQAPETVANCVHAIRKACALPVSIKCRLGTDEQDHYEFLYQFIETTSAAGCTLFIIHARKAWLNGLSPKENREIPPLDYDRVYRLKKDCPHLSIVINGGITHTHQAKQHLNQVDGVMVGREAYKNPSILLEVDEILFSGRPTRINTELERRLDIANQLTPYISRCLKQKIPLKHLTRHTLGLFNGIAGARNFRRVLSQGANDNSAELAVWLAALEQVKHPRADNRTSETLDLMMGN